MNHDLFDQANEAWEAENFNEAFQLMFLSANKGDKYAFNSLGYFYDEGIGTKIDKSMALKWYKMSARHGDITGILNLATFYKSSNNHERAKYWWNKGIALGDGDCALEYAQALIERKSKNVKKIKELLLFTSSTENLSEDSENKTRELLKIYRVDD